MKWNARKKPYPNYGDRRIVDRFLFFPKEMEGEWRWLEKASWAQKYHIFDYEEYSIGKWVDLNDEGWMDR
jgi:hypothetical protein